MECTAPVKSTYQYWKVWVEVGLLTLLCVSQYIGISIGNLALTCCILAIHFFMNDMGECTIGLFCALPAFNLLNLRIGSISMYYLMVFIFWLRYFQYKNWTISKIKFMILFLLLVIRLTSGEITDTLTWFVLISVLVLSFGEEFLDRNIQPVVMYITIVFLVTSLAGYLMLKAGKSIYTKGSVWTGNIRSVRFAGMIGDAVFFSQFCAFLSAANLALGCYNKRYLIPAVILTGCCLALCLESYAKTGMLLIALCAVSSVIWFIWNRLQNKRTAVLSIFLVFASVTSLVLVVNYVLTNTDNLIIQNYMSRFSKSDQLTGRLEIWVHYLNLLANNWQSLFTALPHALYRTPVYTSLGRSFRDTHNIFLESACIFGVIPSLCMIALVFFLMYRCFVTRKGILWQMPICVILASGFTLHGHLEFHYYTLVSIAISFLQIHSTEKVSDTILPDTSEL